MSDALSFAELEGQQVELLPARTVLSMFVQGTDGDHASNGTDGRGFIDIAGVLPGESNGTGSPGGSADGSSGS